MKYIIFCFYFLLLVSCNDIKTIEEKVYEDLLKSKQTEINIKKYTNFQWDNAYLFFNIPSHDQVNKVLNIKYVNYVEFTRPLIFIKDNKIVYYENLPTDIEKIKDGQLIYKDLLNTEKFIKISGKNPKIKAKIIKEADKRFVLIE